MTTREPDVADSGDERLWQAELSRIVVERLAAHAETDDPEVALEGVDFGQWVERRVLANARSGRLARVIANRNAPDGCEEQALSWYVDRVIHFAQQEIHKILALEAGDPEMWQELRSWFQQQVPKHVARLVTSAATAPSIQDFVQEACAAVVMRLDAYHFDAPFEAWLSVMVRNIVLTPVTRSRDLIDRNADVDSLDAVPAGEASLTLQSRVMDEKQQGRFEQVELRLLLVQAMAHLQSDNQRDTLFYTYFRQLPDKEIGHRLDTSAGNVAQLRWRALRRLRHILTANEITQLHDALK